MTHRHKHAVLTPPGKTTSIPKAAVVSDDENHSDPLDSAEAIRLSAYQKWEIAGRPTGDGMQFWLEAEQDLLQNK